MALPASADSAHRSEEGPQVVDEQLGLLHGGEVAAARHVGPVRHVVAPLDPGAREAQHLLGIARDAGGDADELRRRAPEPTCWCSQYSRADDVIVCVTQYSITLVIS